MGKLNLKYGLVTFGLVAAATASTMPGCSADGVSGSDEDSGSAEDATVLTDVGSPQDTGTDSAKDAAADAKKDTGVDAAKDVGVDTGVDSGQIQGPAPGSACTTPGMTYQQSCGFCGKQEAICEATKIVSQYGVCTGEVANGCTPGTSRQSTCGLCGTRNEVCQNNCQWASGSCGGEPMNACSPGAVKYTTAGCSLANTFRKQTCEQNCQFGLPAPLPCGPKDSDLTVSTLVGGSVSAEFDFSAANDQIPRLNSTSACPATINGTSTSYKYITVKNTSAQAAKVEIWFDKVVGGANQDTIVAWYPGTAIPTTQAERLACSGAVNDICSSAPCVGSWSGLVGTQAPTIPANSSIVVYHAGYFASATGSFVMYAKTVSLQ